MPIRSAVIPLDQLLPDARNPKRHSEADVRKLLDRIQAVGFTSPVLVDEDSGVLCAGHRRRLALLWLRENGYAEPPGIEPGWGVPARVGSWSELQRLQVLIGDNERSEEIDFEGQALAALLADLNQADALAGAGYVEADLEALLADIEHTTQLPIAEREAAELEAAERELKPTIKPVIPIEDVSTVERAFAATGIRARGPAFLLICEHYLKTAHGSEAR